MGLSIFAATIGALMDFSNASRVGLIVKTNIHARVFAAATPILACLALFVFLAPQAAAQGCAMCYQSAAATGAQGREVLRHGIFVLLLPSLSLFIGIFALIYKRRNVARSSR
jgi:hypothetical protein